MLFYITIYLTAFIAGYIRSAIFCIITYLNALIAHCIGRAFFCIASYLTALINIASNFFSGRGDAVVGASRGDDGLQILLPLPAFAKLLPRLDVGIVGTLLFVR